MAMADSIWGTGRRIDESLYRTPYQFEFFQAVRLLRLAEGDNVNRTRCENHGAIRFAIHPSLSFPPSPVVEIQPRTEEKSARMVVAFLGLIGPAGVLPIAYTEEAVHQRMQGNFSFAAFFDIFHDRLLSLFYQAWKKHHFVIGYEESMRDNAGLDSLTTYLFDIIGMGAAGLRGRLPFPDVALLRYAGLLAQRPRSAECLRAILQDFLDVPITVEQFIGRWQALDPDDLCRVGDERFSTRLGEGSVAGDVVWTRQSAVRIVVGPIKVKRFFDFLPDGRAFREASGLVRWFLGPTIDFEIQPVIATGEVPGWSRLGESQISGPMLGWCSWLSEEPFARPASDAIFAENECVLAGGRQ
jgi:type VI secretion system protein ImpH